MYVVLKVFNDGNLACFLDNKHGKFLAHYRLNRSYMKLFPGSIVQGDLEMPTSGKHATLRDVSLVQLAMFAQPRSQFFLHFFLEIAYMFLPQRQPATENFLFLRSSIQTDVLVLCEAYPLIGILLSLVILESLGFALPQDIDLPDNVMQVLSHKDSWLVTHGKELTLPQSLLLKYDSIRGVAYAWISECLRDHPQFKKIEKKWLGMLQEIASDGVWKV